MKNFVNIFKNLNLRFAFPFLWRHYGRDFDLDAIDVVSRSDTCDHLGDKLGTQWNLELEKRSKNPSYKPSLVRAMGKAFGWIFFLTHLTNLIIYGGFRMAMPMILGRIIYFSNRYFEWKVLQNALPPLNETISTSTTTTTISTGVTMELEIEDPGYKGQVILYSLLLAADIFGNLLFSHPYFFTLYRYGMNIRVAVTRLVFEKALRVSTSAVQRSSVGRIVNLISNDANRFEVAYVYVTFVLCALPETFVAIACIYYYIGWAAFGTLAIVLFYIPFQSMMANILSRFRSMSITLTDDRLRLMAEILPAMKVIKVTSFAEGFCLKTSVTSFVNVFFQLRF